MLAGINAPKANMKTLKSRRAMLDTLMRHLDMVRLSAGITAALLIGCTGLISGAGPGGTANITPEEALALQKFTHDAYPVLSTVCAACHIGMEPKFLAGNTTSTDPAVQIQAMRTVLLGFDPSVVNLEAPESSRILTKGAHSGPALSAIDSAALLGWLQAEKDAAGATTTTVIITTDKINPLLCTGGVAGDVAGCTTGDASHCCPINVVTLDSAGMPGAEVDFVAQPLSSDLYVSDIYVKASTAGVYMEHPLFVSWPVTGDPIPDTIDRFFAVKLNLAAATAAVSCPGPSCDHIGAGAAAFVGFPPQNRLSITFKVLEAAHPDNTIPPVSAGCGTMGFASFIANVKPSIQGCATQCHSNGGAKNAMDLSGLASTTDNNTCLQVRAHVNFQTVAQSGVLLAPQAGQDAAHPFKLSAASTPTIANFQAKLNTWISVEASEQ
ncbi:hypothetical protein BH11MYX1_BH11MYX1_14080 [soil metagenome]